MTPEQIAAIRSRDEFDHEIGYETFPEQDRHELLAHIDTLTAAVKALPGTDVTGRALAYPGGGSLVSRAAVLVILRGEQPAGGAEPDAGEGTGR